MYRDVADLSTDDLNRACIASGGHLPSGEFTIPRLVSAAQASSAYVAFEICLRCGVPYLRGPVTFASRSARIRLQKATQRRERRT
jgi:hypothetical protein